ncbi:sensor histidine kinase [Solitalea lacus]|uniref:sensor histidine kinase n=1 Tax=Solitalea lacus TaxID=2911172 RepID=UPI001EDC6816|nr:HAMP domain-containing sensor histidine kinase [Solitalea lacus]UKJ06528.1 HAMP domain-containing histidine kinase [Solitalea lacus]
MLFKVQRILLSLSGSKQNFSLEHRMFNLACLINIFLAIFSILVGSNIKPFSTASIIIIVAIALLIIFYYLSRFKHQFKWTSRFFGVTIFIFNLFIWFLAAGSQGPAVFYLFFTVILLLVITHPKYHIPIFLSCLALGIFIYIIEYRNPWLVIGYPSIISKYLHQIIIYTLILMAIFILIYFFRINYDYERFMAIKKKESVTNQNAIISEQYKNLEKRDLIKIKVFSIISHDLRGPLNSLRSLLDLLDEKLITQVEFSELSQQLTDRVDQNLEMLDNLLYWSNTQMQGLEIAPTKTNIHHLIEEFIQLFKGETEKKHLKLVNQMPKESNAFADINMLKVVIRNLISNAIKFTPRNGTISFSSQIADKKIIVSIHDSGVGIKKEHLDKIFNIGHATTLGTENEIGTGLGLILSKDFVERNGGTIWVESEENKGSNFCFSLPLNEA